MPEKSPASDWMGGLPVSRDGKWLLTLKWTSNPATLCWSRTGARGEGGEGGGGGEKGGGGRGGGGARGGGGGEGGGRGGGGGGGGEGRGRGAELLPATALPGTNKHPVSGLQNTFQKFALAE